MPLDKPADTSRTLLPAIRDRWSPRAFSGRPVAPELLVTVLEAGRWAASSSNMQPWRFILATSTDPAAHATAVSCFDDGNQRWVRFAPVLMFTCAAKNRPNGRANRHAWYDLGQAVAQMAIQATDLGLRMHQAGGIEGDLIRKTYVVPDDFDICSGIALGYQAEPEIVPDDLAVREREQRTRRPVAEFVFAGRFGTGAELP